MAESQFLKQVGEDVIRIGGAVKRGIIEKRELQDDEAIRVSIRSSKCLGSIELFTLRHLKPADYQLMLVAIPRNKEVPLSEKKGEDGGWIHTEGSLAAQKMAIFAAADWDRYKAIAKRIAGIPGWKDHPDLNELPDWPGEYIV